MKPLAPALQFSEGRSTTWGGAKLINGFAEKADGDKRADLAVLCTPGLTLWSTAGAGPASRGALMCAGVLYVVSGSTLYSIDSVGGATAHGGIGGTGPVSMAANYTELAIAAGGTGYVLSSGSLTTPCPFSVSSVTYIDGYMLWTVLNSEQFFISSPDDALTYDALDIASVEGAPDDNVGVVTDHREVQFYGEKSTEIFYNSGASAFPIEHQGNAFVERGCFDRNSIIKIDNSTTFVGDDLIVYSLAGYAPQRISTHAIEYQLRNATYARAFTYDQEGHKFYCLDTDNGTFLYDRATGAWHQRKSYGSTHWRVGGGVAAYGKTLLLDRTNGKIYIPDLDVFTEDGNTIELEIHTPTIEAGRERKTMYAFELLCETGVGNVDAATPQVMLQYSDDGGHNWSNEMWRTIMGAVGEYVQRAVWRKLGQFRNRQMKIKITDPVRRLVIGYFVDAR